MKKVYAALICVLLGIVASLRLAAGASAQSAPDGCDPPKISASEALAIATGVEHVEKWPGIEARSERSENGYRVSLVRKPFRVGSAVLVEVSLCGEITSESRGR